MLTCFRLGWGSWSHQGQGPQWGLILPLLSTRLGPEACQHIPFRVIKHVTQGNGHHRWDTLSPMGWQRVPWDSFGVWGC